MSWGKGPGHYRSSLELCVTEAKVRGSFPIGANKLPRKTAALSREFTLERPLLLCVPRAAALAPDG